MSSAEHEPTTRPVPDAQIEPLAYVLSVQSIPANAEIEDADDIAASDAAKAVGIAGSYDDLRSELGL